MEKKINLQPGDSVYYAQHQALGLLIEKFTSAEYHDSNLPAEVWKYALRSPMESDRENIKVSFMCATQEKLLNYIRIGHLEYYKGR